MTHTKKPARIILGISGASGAIYGVQLLEALNHSGVETHLVVSKTAQITLAHETDYTLKKLEKMAYATHAAGDMAAPISSGSFQTLGMIIAPCSMRSVAEIATGVTTSLLTRAADVALKERRRLVLLARETPLTGVHLRNMLTLSDMGAIIAPPVPAFYQKPRTIDDIVAHSVGRALDLFGLESPALKRWSGLKS